jgi:hypothetical protein
MKLRHSGIVSCYNITQERNALYFSFGYHPNAVTLQVQTLQQIM